MTTGALPPRSRWTRANRSAAASATARPVRGEPVTDTIATSRWAANSDPTSGPPHTTFTTPAGDTSASSSAIRYVDDGVSSDGLSTTVLPAATAGAHFHSAIMNA